MPTLQAPAPVLDQAAPRISQLVQQAGIKHFVLVARDPQTNALRLFASPGAMDDLRSVVAEKFGFTDGSETGWPE